MSKTFSEGKLRMAAWCLAVLSGSLVSLTVARAKEPHCDCPVKVIIHEQGVPLLTGLPYIGRLFQSESTACCKETCEQLGVDFDFVAGQVWQLPQCEAAACAAACPAEKTTGGEARCGKECRCPCSSPVTSVSVPAFLCPEVAAVFNTACEAGCQGCQVKTVSATAAAGEGKCSTNCAANCAAKCSAANATAVNVAAACDRDCVSAACACADCQCCRCDAVALHKAAPTTNHTACEVWQHIVELATERAAAQTALAAREELHEARSEMFESMAELLVEKGKLEAKLEAASEFAEMMGDVHELVAENAKLKAQAELAAQREGLLRESLQLALENERLKLRVAELERENSAERTAAKPQRERNADQPPRL
jgi:hypothetical protein